jgi:hypothetical protein
MTPEEVAELRRLTDEFQNELRSLGTDVAGIKKRLDDLARDIAAINDRLNRMPVITGDFFFGVRANRSRSPFFDYSGAANDSNHSLIASVEAVHDFHLGIHANIPGGGRFNGDLVASNYLPYRADMGGGAGLGGVPPVAALNAPGNIALGGPSGANLNGLPEAVTLYTANLQYPIGGFGSNTVLTLGRYKNQVTPLTYYRPDTDAYFDLPWYDDGNFVEDGVKLEARFGIAHTSLWAGSYSNLSTTTTGLFINKPQVGATVGPRYGTFFKPTDFATGGMGAVSANQSAGIHIGVPLFNWGEVGITLIDFTTGKGLGFPAVTGQEFVANPAVLNGGNYGNVVVYGANFKLNQLGKLTGSAEASKSVTQLDSTLGDGRQNDDNNAYTLNVGYATGPLNVQAGYQYIDPRFAAPGYWNKIGNWYNPTNIQGPFARVSYDVNHSVQVYLGGDYYQGARNRRGAAYGGPGTGFGPGDSLVRATAGVKYSPFKVLNLRADYEGVFWNIQPSDNPFGVRGKAIEQYITLGAGVNLTGNTVLKMAYQILAFRDDGNAFDAVAAFPGGVSNASVFTTQVAVHF